MPQMEHALTGLRVLDFTRALAGPTCTRMLAEMGAEVIKVEPAPKGDMSRAASVYNKRSLFYVQHNRGKKSLCVNLRDARGMALVAELVRHVDVVVQDVVQVDDVEVVVMEPLKVGPELLRGADELLGLGAEVVILKDWDLAQLVGRVGVDDAVRRRRFSRGRAVVPDRQAGGSRLAGGRLAGWGLGRGR